MRRKKRNQMKTKAAIVVLLWVFALAAMWAILTNQDKIQQYWAEASGKEANLVVDLSLTRSLARPWANIAQGGESADYTFGETVTLLKAVKPAYVRLDHIYDQGEMVKRVDGRLVFDWTRLDVLIGEIRAAGAKPFISLSYMPPAISSGDVVDAPRDWNEWALVVQKTVEHVSGKNGLNLSDVYYEVWNEPDLFGGWKVYGEKNYLVLYEYAAMGASRAVGTNPYKLGGPATTSNYKNWAESLVRMTKSKGLRLDFYSWHYYDADVEKLEQQLVDYWDWTKEAFVEPVITEWGFSSEMHAGFDGNMSAAHLVAGSAAAVGRFGKLFIFEWQDGLDPAGGEYWGRWGMLTHESFGSRAKPRYYALKWLQELEGKGLSIEGQGSWVKAVGAVGDDGVVRVVVANYDPRGTHAEEVPILFEGLSPGVYTVRTSRLGGQMSEIRVMIESSSYSLMWLMQANEVGMVELIQD